MEAVLLFIMKGERILLARRSPEARVGPNTWNGYGGKIEPGENPRQAVLRELREEAGDGIIVKEEDLVFRGVVTFYNKGLVVFKANIFVVNKFSGLPRQTEEMLTPTWFDWHDAPWQEMMPADRLFLPLILAGKTIQDGWVVFTPDMKRVERYSFSTRP